MLRPADLGLLASLGQAEVPVWRRLRVAFFSTGLGDEHTHDGQLFPVNLITARRYELSWGYEKKGPTHVFVSCGVQLWGPRVRTAGVSEIMLVDVTFR